MLFPTIRESVSELTDLEQQNPMMRDRLRFFRFVKTHSMSNIEDAANNFGIFSYDVERWARLYQAGGIGLLLHPLTRLAPQQSQQLTFSQHAEIRTLELFKEHNNQIGRQLWVEFQKCKAAGSNSLGCEVFLKPTYQDFEKQFKDWYRTDCQTYILDVLRYAFEKIGYKKLYTELLAAFKREGTTGTVMAKYLVSKEWKAFFFMPDTENPNDRDAEHTKMYQKALKTKTWWNVPITDFVVDYNLTNGGRDAEGNRKFNVLSTALFGVGVFTKGLHTALFSKGNIYEVHWTGISDNKPDSPVGTGDDLYERGPLRGYGWIEGVIVVPPDISL